MGLLFYFCRWLHNKYTETHATVKSNKTLSQNLCSGNTLSSLPGRWLCTKSTPPAAKKEGWLFTSRPASQAGFCLTQIGWSNRPIRDCADACLATEAKQILSTPQFGRSQLTGKAAVKEVVSRFL